MSDTRPAAGPTGKGRPTPKRSEKERRTGPVAPPPRTRKEAAQRLREQQAADRKAGRTATALTDPDRMMARDKGPVRALVRDVVDRRRNVGVLLLPLAVLLVATQLVGTEQVFRISTSLWTGGLLAVLLDMALLGLAVRRTVREAHPDEPRVLRHVGYALLRSTVFRRLRTPPTVVHPAGAEPAGAPPGGPVLPR